MDEGEGSKEFSLSSYANPKELWYRNVVQPQEETYSSPEKWIQKIRGSGRLSLLPYVEREGGLHLRGSILECGAGSCWLSAELSKRPHVDKIVALDFSEHLLNEVAPHVIQALGGEMRKIERRLGDMHVLPWGVNSFDFVFLDSTLHHTNFPVRVLCEIHRVLKKNGALICLREPVRPKINWHRPESMDALRVKKLGVIEKHLSRDELIRWFTQAGFLANFIPVTFLGGFKGKLSRRANPWWRGDYCIIALKEPSIS